MTKRNSNILITGATSGIGRHAALALARAGHRVFATGRRLAALDLLRQEASGTRLETIELDVTSTESIASAKAEIDRRTNGYGVDALINNAGYGAMGPLEEISDAVLRAQYDTNVFGLMTVTRSFLPKMRERGFGRIVNISSIGGLVPSPLMGAYSSTKYAVEALSDALRIELRPFGVKVVLIEPGAIATEFNGLAVSSLPSGKKSPYQGAIERSHAVFERFARASVGAEHVTRAIFAALFTKSPSARYIRPWRTYVMLWLNRLLPTSWSDALFANLGGLTRAQLGLTRRLSSNAATTLSAVLLTAMASTALADEGWKKVSEQQGVKIERRAVEGSNFDELRASARAPIAPARFFETVSNFREFPQFVPYLKKLEVLGEGDSGSDVYQQIAMPMVPDRDYVIRMQKVADVVRQRYQMTFASVDAGAPKPCNSCIRAKSVHGGWYLEPSEDGQGTIVTYRMHSDPGGALPSWIVNTLQRNAPRDLVLAMIDRARGNK